MFVVELEELRRSEARRSQWKEKVDELRALGDACLEIAEKMEGVLEQATTGEKSSQPRKAG